MVPNSVAMLQTQTQRLNINKGPFEVSVEFSIRVSVTLIAMLKMGTAPVFSIAISIRLTVNRGPINLYCTLFSVTLIANTDAHCEWALRVNSH